MYTVLLYIACYSVKVCEWPDMAYIVICVFVIYELRYSTGGRVWSI